MRAFIFIFLLLPRLLKAQGTAPDDVNQQRNGIAKKGMGVLGGWAFLNTATGFTAAQNETGSAKYFHLMNGYVGSVNLLLAGAGYRKAVKNKRKRYMLSQTVREQELAEKLFLFNTGLDLAYVAGGGYLNQRGNRFTGNKRDKLQGYGRSVMLQGGFLFLFDGIMYLLQTRLGKKLNANLFHLSFTTPGKGGGLPYRL